MASTFVRSSNDMAKRRDTQAATLAAFATASAVAEHARYVLTLYVTGTTPHSRRAVVNIRRFCEAELQGRYDLEIVDLCQNPALAAGELIIAAPTLIKRQPLPERRFIGDMSKTGRLREGLELRPPADSG